jgi:hypothetical protein
VIAGGIIQIQFALFDELQNCKCRKGLSYRIAIIGRIFVSDLFLLQISKSTGELVDYAFRV